MCCVPCAVVSSQQRLFEQQQREAAHQRRAGAGQQLAWLLLRLPSCTWLRPRSHNAGPPKHAGVCERVFLRRRRAAWFLLLGKQHENEHTHRKQRRQSSETNAPKNAAAVRILRLCVVYNIGLLQTKYTLAEGADSPILAEGVDFHGLDLLYVLLSSRCF